MARNELRLGEPLTLAIAAAGMALGGVAMLHWPLATGENLDLRPSRHLPEPQVEEEPEPEAGPVLVTTEYHVEPEHAVDFMGAMREVGRLRRRDGALRWGLFRDPASPGRYVESFIVEFWAEHLRQHERATVADREIDERARAFVSDPEGIVVSHLVAARPPDGTEPVTLGV